MLKEVLHEIRSFLDEHPAEVVLLDVNHIFGMEGAHPHARLKELIADALGWTSLCPQMNPLECTLEFMREHGYRLVTIWNLENGFRAVVFLCGEADGLFWSQEAIISRWPMTNKAKKLIGFLDVGVFSYFTEKASRIDLRMIVRSAGTVSTSIRES